MGLFEDILARHNGDKGAAGIEVAFGLMRGDPATHKAGYTAANAVLAVRDLYGLNGEEVDRVASTVDPTGVDRGTIDKLADQDARNRFSGPSREHDDAPGDAPLTEGDHVTLAPFEDQPRQTGRYLGVSKDDGTVLVVLLDRRHRDGPEDDGLREVGRDQVEGW